MGATPNLASLSEWMFLMQHHQVPTRLLDWTESALIALFFAVYNKNTCIHPCVWMLDPFALNELTTEQRAVHQPWSRTAEEYFANAVDPKPSFKNNLPLAICALHRHRRMSSQQSCFTIHGLDSASIEEQTRKTLVANGRLIKYEFNPEARADIILDLKVLGITYSVLFPDLDGLARDIRAEYE